MSIVGCWLQNKNATLSIDEDFKRTYTHDFLVETNSKDDIQGDVYVGALAASPDPVPSHWTQYNEWNSGTSIRDPYVYLQKVEIKRKEDGEDAWKYWIITCHWAPPKPGTDSSTPPDINPLNEPIRYHLEWAHFTRLVEKDNSGNPIINSAGDLFDPPIEIDDARPVLVAVRNMYPLQNIIDLAIEYKNAVNTDTFYGATARTCKVESIQSGTIQERNGQPFYAVTFRVEFNEDTWDKLLVDRGTQVLEQDATGTGYHKAWPKKRNSDGSLYEPEEFLDMVNLNSDGTHKVTGPALFKTPAYRIYPEKAFSGLGI